MGFNRHGELEIDLRGSDGNAFVILAYIKRALNNNGYDPEQVDYWMSKMKSGDYENLCRVAEEAYYDAIGDPIYWHENGKDVTLDEFFKK